jgi:hypothetical protein
MAGSPDYRVLVTTLTLAGSRVTQTNVLVAEAMINHSLQNKVKSSGKDVIRAIISDLAGNKNGMQESHIQPVLLKSAMAMLG